jgi:hypothetical protein
MVKIIKCKCCNEEKPHNGFNLCKSCYSKLKPKEKCNHCGEIKKVVRRIEKLPYCSNCYNKFFKPKHKCFKCKEVKAVSKWVNDQPVCIKCYNKFFYSKEECFICKKIKRVNMRVKRKPYCNRCNINFLKLKEKCNNCGRIRSIAKKDNGNVYCSTCYEKLFKPRRQCSQCNKIKIICKIADDKFFCKICYEKNRKLEDENYRLTKLLRDRVRKAFNKFSSYGKISTSKEYGINYVAIIEFLGPCPGKREDYHIDHIFPLDAFDFNDLEQIKRAFAPENHQWLTKEENLSKFNKYNEEDFKKYIGV